MGRRQGLALLLIILVLACKDTQGLSPCDVINGQWWMRDPQNPDGTGVALSDGIQLEIGV